MTSMIMSFIVWALCGDLRAKAMAHAQAAGGECLGRWVHWAEGSLWADVGPRGGRLVGGRLRARLCGGGAGRWSYDVTTGAM